MRLTNYIAEAKKFGYYEDNPGGEWLEHEIERAKKSKLGGAVTAGFHDFVQIPTSMFNGLRGMQGEHEIRKLTDPDVQELMKAIKVEGIYNPVFITIFIQDIS